MEASLDARESNHALLPSSFRALAFFLGARVCLRSFAFAASVSASAAKIIVIESI
jgi:hypothetical protein